jgi:hypothetical protein
MHSLKNMLTKNISWEMKTFGFVRIQNYLFVTGHGKSVVQGCSQSDELISKAKRSLSLVLNYFREMHIFSGTADAVSDVAISALG